MKIAYVAWAAMFIALAGLFWNVSTGFNRVHERIDHLQAETNGRFDALQAENNRRFDQSQAENTRRFDTAQTEMNQMRAEMNQMQAEMNGRFDTMQAENQRQHDAMEEVLRIFEGRMTRLEEKADIGPEGAE